MIKDMVVNMYIYLQSTVKSKEDTSTLKSEYEKDMVVNTTYIYTKFRI